MRDPFLFNVCSTEFVEEGFNLKTFTKNYKLQT